jgi:thymidylate kinase
MKRLIILEGIDCTGKTTLAAAIAKQLNAVRLKCTASPDLFIGLQDYHKNMLHNAKLNLENSVVVMDRFWPSEVAYGAVMRPNLPYDNSVIEKAVLELDHVYVLCTDTDAGERYFNEVNRDDPAHKLTPEQFDKIEHNYIQIFKTMENREDTQVVLYSMTVEGKDEKSLEKFINGLVGEA